MLRNSLVQATRVEDVVHAVVQGVDDVDARVGAGRRVELADGAAGGGADVGDVRGGAGDTGDGEEGCLVLSLVRHGDGEGGLADGLHVG